MLNPEDLLRSPRWRVVALLLVLAGILAAGWWQAARPVCPDKEWARRPPEKAGFSAEKLARFSNRAGGDGCIVQNGRIIHEWGDVASRSDIGAAAKPIYAFLVFKAIEEGLIESLDDPLVRWAPELAAHDARNRELTFRHLLVETPGYDLGRTPEGMYAPNDPAAGWLVHILLQRVYDMHPRYFNQLLNGPLLGRAIRFEDEPTAFHFRSRKGRIRISVRDLARFALLLRRGGVWNGRRVLHRDLVRLALRTPSAEDLVPGRSACLGFAWWFNGRLADGSRLLPDAPPDTFLGQGYGGRTAMVVMPGLDLIAVWSDIPMNNRNRGDFEKTGRLGLNDLIRDLLAARIDSTK